LKEAFESLMGSAGKKWVPEFIGIAG